MIKQVILKYAIADFKRILLAYILPGIQIREPLAWLTKLLWHMCLLNITQSVLYRFKHLLIY